MESIRLKAICENLIAFTYVKMAPSPLYSNSYPVYNFPANLWMKVEPNKVEDHARKFAGYKHIKQITINIPSHLESDKYTQGYKCLEYAYCPEKLVIIGAYSYPELALTHLLYNKRCALKELVLIKVPLNNKEIMIKLLRKFPALHLTVGLPLFVPQISSQILMAAKSVHFTPEKSLCDAMAKNAKVAQCKIENLQLSLNMTVQSGNSALSALGIIKPLKLEILGDIRNSPEEISLLTTIFPYLPELQEIKCSANNKDFFIVLPRNLQLLSLNTNKLAMEIKSIAARTPTLKKLYLKYNELADANCFSFLSKLQLEVLHIYHISMTPGLLNQICEQLKHNLALTELCFELDTSADDIKPGCSIQLNSIEQLTIFDSRDSITRLSYDFQSKNIIDLNLINVNTYKLKKLDLCHVQISENSLNCINEILQHACLTCFKIHSPSLDSIIPNLSLHIERNGIRSIFLRGSINEGLINCLIKSLTLSRRTNKLLFENSGCYSRETHLNMCTYVATSSLKSFGIIYSNITEFLQYYFNAAAKCVRLKCASLYDRRLVCIDTFYDCLSQFKECSHLKVLCLPCHTSVLYKMNKYELNIKCTNYWKPEFDHSLKLFGKSLAAAYSHII